MSLSRDREDANTVFRQLHPKTARDYVRWLPWQDLNESAFGGGSVPPSLGDFNPRLPLNSILYGISKKPRPSF